MIFVVIFVSITNTTLYYKVHMDIKSLLCQLLKGESQHSSLN